MALSDAASKRLVESSALTEVSACPNVATADATFHAFSVGVLSPSESLAATRSKSRVASAKDTDSRSFRAWAARTSPKVAGHRSILSASRISSALVTGTVSGLSTSAAMSSR